MSLLNTVLMLSFRMLCLQGNGASHSPPSNENPELLPSQELYFIDSFADVYGVINNRSGENVGAQERETKMSVKVVKLLLDPKKTPLRR